MERNVKIVLVFFLAAVAFFAYFTPLGEGDFFWHLKTGGWIWEHRALPAVDPFNCTSPAQLSTMQRFTLTSYWLSQVLYHLTVQAAGLGGIVLLNFFILAALMFALYLGREGDDLLYLGLMTIFLCLLGLVALERPQAFSFVFFAALLAVLARLRSASPGSRAALLWAAAVPLLMVIWSNAHGGYLLGQTVLVLGTAADGWRLWRTRPGNVERERRLVPVIAGAAGLACSLLNPNSWHAVEYLRPGASALLAVNIEYQSPLFVFRQLRLPAVALYWLFLALCIPALLLRRREPDYPRIALLLLLGYFSFRQIRYVPFFCIAALPFIGRGLSGTAYTRRISAVVVAAALVIGGASLWQNRGNPRATRAGGWVSGTFPVKAADFILANDLQGNIYNFYGWGGYLIWRLGPRMKVFLDGRGLDDGIFRLSRLVEQAGSDPETGIPAWRTAFGRYDVGVVVMPVFSAGGQVFPLTLALLDDPGWSCVVADLTSLVFIRLSPENLRVAASRGMNRTKVIDGLGALCDRKLASGPASQLTAISLGEIHQMRGRLAEARAAFTLASRLAPGSELARQRLAAVERLLGAPGSDR